MTTWRLLACLAHPDDEAFISGGVLAMSTAQGAEAHLVCATYGEAGDIRTPGSATPETLAEVRHAETVSFQEAYKDRGTRKTSTLEAYGGRIARSFQNDLSGLMA